MGGGFGGVWRFRRGRRWWRDHDLPDFIPREVRGWGRRGSDAARGGLFAEEFLDVFPVEGGGELFFVAEEALQEIAFAVLEVEDLFLDGAAGDELVTGDNVLLADAMGAVGGLAFNGGIPPGIEMDDGIGAGEVEADAAGFEADEEDRDGGVVLELVDDLGAVAGGAVEVTEGDFAGGQVFADQREHLGELAEDEDAVATVEDLLEEFIEEFQFTRGGGAGGFGGGRRGGGVEGEQSQIATDLAESEQGGEDEHAVDGGCLGTGGVEDFAAAGFEDLLIDGALIVGEITGADLFDFVGEIGGDVAFQTTEEERLEAARKTVLNDPAAVADEREFVAFAEIGGGTEVTGHQEIEDRPEIENGVFDRGAGEDEAMKGGDGFDGLGVLGLAVFDVLGFVEDDGVERWSR